MEFTKENILGVFGDFRRGQLSFDNLEKEIMDLDDTPEKVVVPKCFDEWFKEIYERGPIKNARKQFALWKICQFGFGSYLQNVNGEDIKDCELSTWVGNNRMIAINAVLNGYEVEKEPRYEVIIAGKHLIKMFHGRIDHEFAKKTELCAWAKVSYQLTESEIKAIDERYWAFAVRAND